MIDLLDVNLWLSLVDQFGFLFRKNVVLNVYPGKFKGGKHELLIMNR